MKRVRWVYCLMTALPLVLTGCYALRVVKAAVKGDAADEELAPVRPEVKKYSDPAVAFEHPPAWSVEVVDARDPQTHSVAMRGLDGQFARLTLLRAPQDPGAFSFEVLQNMQRANPSLVAEPFVVNLAGQEARGNRYRFAVGQVTREGWVASRLEGTTEICFLGQFPSDAPPGRREELLAVMRSVRLLQASAPRGP